MKGDVCKPLKLELGNIEVNNPDILTYFYTNEQFFPVHFSWYVLWTWKIYANWIRCYRCRDWTKPFYISWSINGFFLESQNIFVIFWYKVILHDPITKVCSDIACSNCLSRLGKCCTVIDGFHNWNDVTVVIQLRKVKLDIATCFLVIWYFLHSGNVTAWIWATLCKSASVHISPWWPSIYTCSAVRDTFFQCTLLNVKRALLQQTKDH